MATNDKIGPYELREELGRGAMARVWRAWDPNLAREVAIKEPLFDPQLPEAVHEEMGRRFVGEGRAAARLSHPGIVTIYAADVWDDRPAIVMELIGGETLASRLSRGPMAPSEALSVLDQLLDAAGYAHAQGVVHRDIKPDNVFVEPSGRVKLADFGIARVDGSVGTMGTVVGAVLGTPGYMSPEQATGGNVDARSDLFSIGVVSYETLTGDNPFGAGLGTDATTLIYRIVHEPAPELPLSSLEGLPDELRAAIMCALCKDPAGRPQTAEEFRAMLRGQATPPARPTSVGQPVSPSAHSLPRWLPYAIVTGVALCLSGLILLSALGGGGSASGGSVVTQQPDASIAVDHALSPYYLAVSDGKVAIFSNSSATPYEVTDVEVSDLGAASAAELDARVPAASIEEALELVSSYRSEAEEARIAREDAEALYAMEAEDMVAEDDSIVDVSIMGADGTTRTATIRRQGSSERVFPDSNFSYLSEGEVAALSDAERCIAWNEIIAASNGYAFKNSDLADYFASCSWYFCDPYASGEGVLTDEARANVDLLKSYTDDWWLHLAT